MTAEESATWEHRAKISRDVLENSTPRQWMMDSKKLPPTDVLSVMHIIEESGMLSAEKIDMMRQRVENLTSNYQSGRWTAEAVTLAFLKRATVSHQLVRNISAHETRVRGALSNNYVKTNFATEFLAESALETARSLDSHFRATGSLAGPLHGIPISVKVYIDLTLLSRLLEAG